MAQEKSSIVDPGISRAASSFMFGNALPTCGS